MNVIIKKILIALAIVGGMSLAAMLHSSSALALSDTSSTATTPTTTDTTSAPTTSTTTTSTTAPTTSSTSTTTPTTSSTTAPTASTGTTTSPNTSLAPSTTTTTTPTTPTTTTTTTTTPTTPTTPTPLPNSVVAGGSSATQNTTDTANSNSSTSATQTPANSTPTDAITQTNNTSLSNNVSGTSGSGDASVTYNQTGGNATSGNSSGTANIVNAVASSDSLSGGGLQTFTDNINGTHNGNIVLNPNTILPAGSSTSNSTPTQTDANVQNNTTINNNVNLMATSGNATVANNRGGGSATTGYATTQADIINLVESLISNKQSFVGIINIYGTLNGNIVLPASLVNSLLKQTPGGSGVSGNVTATNNVSINNDVSLTALSGTATVINNGRGGNATSGNAMTSLNIYNLINSQIVGGNVLLVFVNVMGHWYGLLMNAPAGTTSTALGGGIQADTALPASNVTATNNVVINNVVNLWSQTGNATVASNGRGGNATTGNATAIADIVNIVGTQINLTGWLGILIINVFGTWNGSLIVASPASTHHSSHQNAAGAGNDPVVSAYIFFIDPPQNTGQIVAAAQPLGDPSGNRIVHFDPNSLSTTLKSIKNSDKNVFIISSALGAALLLFVALTLSFRRLANRP